MFQASVRWGDFAKPWNAVPQHGTTKTCETCTPTAVYRSWCLETSRTSTPNYLPCRQVATSVILRDSLWHAVAMKFLHLQTGYGSNLWCRLLQATLGRQPTDLDRFYLILSNIQSNGVSPPKIGQQPSAATHHGHHACPRQSCSALDLWRPCGALKGPLFSPCPFGISHVVQKTGRANIVAIYMRVATKYASSRWCRIQWTIAYV